MDKQKSPANQLFQFKKSVVGVERGAGHGNYDKVV